MPVSRISIDGQTVPGCIGVDGHHWGRDWPAIIDMNDPRSIQWVLTNAEYIPAMNAIAPRGIVEWVDMDLTGWTETAGNGYWCENRPGITLPRCKFLHFRKAVSGSGGRVISTAAYRPGIYIRALRFVPVDGETGIPRLGIELDGGTGYYKYGLDLPWGDCSSTSDDYSRPKLYRVNSGTAFDLDEPIAIMPETPADMTAGSNVLIQDISIEQLDGYLLIRLSNAQQPWLIENGATPLTKSTVAVAFTGHCGMFNVQPIKWPMIATAVPVNRISFPSWCSDDVTYAGVGWVPTDTTVVLSADTSGGETRPTVTFSAIGSPYTRPLLYNVQMWTSPNVTAATPAPATFNPETISWRRTNDWRGASFSAEYRDYGNDLSIRPNMQLTLQTGWTSTTTTTRIIGYAKDASSEYAGTRYGGKYRDASLEAEDHITARLSQVKWMRHMPDFTLWEADDLFEFLLSTAGVDASFITVDEGVTVDPLPRGNPPWENRWAYTEQTGLIQAMDEIFVDYWGLQWGWNESGYFLREKPEYSGIPDWTIDTETTTLRQMITRLQVHEDTSNIRNYVATKAADGMIYTARDEDSHLTPTAQNYIGDDRWEILSGSSITSTDAAASVQSRLAELNKTGLIIQIETEYDGVGPDEFVLIEEHSDPLIADNSVYRIISEAGRATADDMTITYTCQFDSIQEA